MESHGKNEIRQYGLNHFLKFLNGNIATQIPRDRTEYRYLFTKFDELALGFIQLIDFIEKRLKMAF